MPYIGVSPQFGVRRKHTYTATAGQTSFSGAGSEGATLSYKDSNFVDVYQNGVKLGDADYTSTSGTAIVLAQGASVDDLLEIIVFDAFSAADTVSKADGGQFDGNVTMAGTLGVTGATTLTGGVSGDTTFTGDLTIPQKIIHSGDTDTHIALADNQIDLTAGDVNIFQGVSNEVVINQGSADVNFRVEGNGEANLLLIDAGEDNVKIGDNAGNYGKLSLRNEAAGAQERGLYVEVAPASGTSPNNVAVFSATNANLTTPVVRIHHESPTANQIMLQTTTTGSNTVKFSVDEDGEIFTNSGVYFGAVADANLLDDYEEGTWTPALSQPSSTVGTWGSSLTGTYTKVGRLVNVHCSINGSGMRFSSTAGYYAITGMPFTATQPSGTINYAGAWSGDSVASSSGGSVYLYSSTMYIHSSNSGQASSGVNNIGVSITYYAT
tara:strand:+ start:2524 stop:3834 length:1311 start_codon:yes stop_codon:yes gene_type:complete